MDEDLIRAFRKFEFRADGTVVDLADLATGGRIT